MAVRSAPVVGGARPRRPWEPNLAPATRLRLAFVRARLLDLAVPTVFFTVSLHRLAVTLATDSLAIDIRIYRASAAAWLAGTDPWVASVNGLRSGAPPPSLLPYLPAALMPDIPAILIYGAIGVIAGVLLIRALALPWWWLLFPPLVDSVLVGNPDVLVALLVFGGGTSAGFAVVLKAYAAIPLLVQRRWVPLAVAAAVALITVPLWPLFWADRGLIADAFDKQSAALSAWGTPLLVPAALAIIALRGRGAEWLAIPALWPYTQLHYATLALPALRARPLLAIGLSFVYPLLPPAAIIGQASWETWRRWRARRAVPPREVVAALRPGAA
jgi:hypothetical protein